MAFVDQRVRDRPDVAGRAASARVESDRTMSGERVLVVDDEPIVTEVVQRYLIREGYQVRIAADGRSALQAAREGAPDPPPASLTSWPRP